MVLVVEPDSDLREVLCAAFGSFGYRAIGTGSAQAAVDLLARGAQPCLALVDCSNPEASAEPEITALRELSERAPRVVQMSTGRHCIEVGRVLEKPFLFEQLLEELEGCEPEMGWA